MPIILHNPSHEGAIVTWPIVTMVLYIDPDTYTSACAGRTEVMMHLHSRGQVRLGQSFNNLLSKRDSSNE